MTWSINDQSATFFFFFFGVQAAGEGDSHQCVAALVHIRSLGTLPTGIQQLPQLANSSHRSAEWYPVGLEHAACGCARGVWLVCGFLHYIYNQVLLQRRSSVTGFTVIAHCWVQRYIGDRMQFMMINGARSRPQPLWHGYSNDYSWASSCSPPIHRSLSWGELSTNAAWCKIYTSWWHAYGKCFSLSTPVRWTCKTPLCPLRHASRK